MNGTIFKDEDNLARWDEAVTTVDGQFVTAGTGFWELRNSADVSLGTGAMSYVPGTRGRWDGVIPKLLTSTLTIGETYYIEISLDAMGTEGKRRNTAVCAWHSF